MNFVVFVMLIDVVDYIDYVCVKVGIDVVGIGFDYDGIILVLNGFEDVFKFFEFFVEFLWCGYIEVEFCKIVLENLLCVLCGVEVVVV